MFWSVVLECSLGVLCWSVVIFCLNYKSLAGVSTMHLSKE